MLRRNRARLTTSFAASVWATVFTVIFGCQHTDYGNSCEQLLGPTKPIQPTGDPTTTQTAEVVAQSAAFPCEQLICVASGGTSGYCSGKCLDDAGCPTGFTCRVIQDVGPFAGQKFCTWKTCGKRQDCGGTDFCCDTLPNANPNQAYRLCSYAQGGKC